MRRYSSRMHKEKGSGRALELAPFFRDGFFFFLIFRILILILYTTDFNPRINKDIIVIIIMKPNIFRIEYTLPMIQTTTTTNV